MFLFTDKSPIYPGTGEQGCYESMIMNRIADIFPISPIAILPFTHNTTKYVIISDIYITTLCTIAFHHIESSCNKFTSIRSLLLMGAIGKSAQ
jgi:NADH:ubiquinone oxidoreductase subunit 5 (subunit L)/multisubunit Na+/H+ antiporter MnhA subunit